jgi:predicted RNA-binding Zn ribbon-like protein
MNLEWDCIRFTQTIGWEARDAPEELLSDYDSLVDWCADRGIVSGKYAEEAREQARKRPEQARAALEDARRLRLAIYRILGAVGTGQEPDPAPLGDLNAYLQRTLPSRRLTVSPTVSAWSWQLDPLRLDHLLGPIAWSAAELLTSPEAARLSLCAADDCGWLFVDGSRNHSRRWCDMSDCGNRAKVRRFRDRQRARGRGQSRKK